ncbi:helix-turn-helix domain-containing protein [Halalkalibacterium halodurans]|uniref:helix-turn-helix domain-containing protein n=1 Tax=Halalkalibacterium halodurans TaxID=86665 RepID=UPI002AA9D8C6|nr:helix-turn-helix transcriptional regulator [Halalkalibacterium halodurans]MDY7224673.1 helix-turn-helix transcriptional regulator [Halalkalibacterium halodurans]MDY7243277.1 helix-turn-helix transcriptional regulator [Halalkalibacterium halodurans]
MNELQKKLMGQRIKQCRTEMNLSQEGLAERLGMKRTNIANYEAGRVVPPGNVILELANILGVTTDYLLGRTDTPDKKVDPLYSSLRQIQRARKKLPTQKERERMDRMLEMIKLSFVDAFNEEDDEDDDL